MATVVVGVLLATGLMIKHSSAAFNTTNGNTGNRYSNGTVTLTDDHQPGTAMINASNVKPGDTGQSCIVLTYTGKLVGNDNAGVRLFVNAGDLTGTGLDSYLDLTVQQGTGSAADCSDFVATAPVYSGATLATFAATKTSFVAGAGVWVPTATGQTKTYRVTWSLQDNNLAQGKTMTVAFSWQSQATTLSNEPTGPILTQTASCIDDQFSNTSNGNPIVVYGCNAGASQNITIKRDGTLRTLGKCLDVTTSGTANGTLIQLYNCNGTVAQQWVVQSNGTIVNPNSGRCLYAPSTVNLTQLQIWDCNAASALMNWSPYTGAPMGSTGTLVGPAGKCVDDRTTKLSNANPVQLYPCNASTAQTWTLGTNGTVWLLGRCLDVASGGTANGTLVQLFACTGGTSQQWVPLPNGALVNVLSGKCLYAPATADSTQLQIWTCDGSAAQTWTLT